MKILYAATYNTLSGANRSLLALIEEEKKMGNEVCVVTPHIKGKHTEIYEALEKINCKQKVVYATTDITPRNVAVPLKIKIKTPIKNVFAEIQIAVLILRFRPDIYHINTLTSYNGYYAAKILRVPIVWHMREFIEEDYNFVFFNSQKVYRMLHKVDAVIAISDSIKNKFSNLINRPDIYKIYNGIDIAKYENNSPKLFSSRRIRFALVGRIIPGKGQKDAILAVKKLVNAGMNNIELFLYGGEAIPEYEQQLIDIVKSNNLPVNFCGVADDMQRVYSEIDVVLVCSRAEAFGRVTIEAMLANCLVIGANSAGTKELIQNGVNGLLYEVGNYLDLSARMKYALTNIEEMKRIVNYAHIWVKNNFTATNNAKKVSEVYANIIKKK